MKHTKGPWDWSGPCPCDNSYHVGTIGEKGVTGIHIDDEHSMQDVIADVWVDDMDDPLVVSEAEANAELIAKAPTMYDRIAELEAQNETLKADKRLLMHVVHGRAMASSLPKHLKEE